MVAELEAIEDFLLECRLVEQGAIELRGDTLQLPTGDERWPHLRITYWHDDGRVTMRFADDNGITSGNLFRCKATNLPKVASFVSGVLAFTRS